MKRFLVACCLALFLCIQCYGEEQKTFKGSSTYFNYTLEYPSGWQALDMKGFAVIMAPTENEEKIIVIVSDLSKKPTSLKDFSDIWLELAPLESQDFQVIDEGESVIGGKEALFHVYTGKSRGIDLKCKRYAFSKGSNIYELTYEAREEHFFRYLADAENIIKSIKIKK